MAPPEADDVVLVPVTEPLVPLGEVAVLAALADETEAGGAAQNGLVSFAIASMQYLLPRDITEKDSEVA